MKANILAKIVLYATNAGGRKGPTPSDQFGCLIAIGDEYFDCRILLDSVGSLSPGQTATVPIRFLRPELVMPLLSQSNKFLIWDGRVVGSGEVEKVLPT